eukprot:9497408-Pyramimonas_sp.AAC.1
MGDAPNPTQVLIKGLGTAWLTAGVVASKAWEIGKKVAASERVRMLQTHVREFATIERLRAVSDSIASVGARTCREVAKSLEGQLFRRH